MTQYNLQQADKNIVRRKRIGNETRNEMRSVEEKNYKNYKNKMEDDLKEELIVNHAKLILKYQYVWMTGVVIGFIFAGMHSTQYLFGVFAIPSLIVCLCSVRAAKRFLNIDKTNGVKQKWKYLFYAIQIAYGLVWSALFVVTPYTPSPYLIDAHGLIATIMLMGFAILSAHNLRFGVTMTIVPCVIVFSAGHVMQNGSNQMALTIVLLGLCGLFEYLSRLMRESTISHLHSKAMRDQLVIELEEATTISDEARRRAEDANLAKSRFLATMSHELRTPLNAVIGFSEAMDNEVMGPLNNKHYKEYVADIHESGSHLLKLINEILDLSRVEAGKYEMNEEPTSLAKVAKECQKMVKMKTGKKRININMQLQTELPNIKADARAVRQIILNLLSNALKFTPENGKIIVKVGWTQDDGQFVSIKDSGPGIPAEEIPVVLSSFGQGSIAIKSAEQGTGLGLPIVQALMHMHNGHFCLQSKLREGTEVIATFPKSRVLGTRPKEQSQVA